MYESVDAKRFRKNTAALVNDLRRSKKERTLSVVQRAEYLYLESLFSDRKVDFKLLQRKSTEFTQEYKESSYKARVTYLHGVSSLNTGNIESGRKILNKLIEEKETPDYLKGLARTELSSLELKNRTL